MEFFRDKDWDIVGRWKTWFAFSALLTVIGLVAWGISGLNFGIDFTGGSLHRYAFDTPLAQNDSEVAQAIAKVRTMATPMGLGSAQIQIVGDERGRLNTLYIRGPVVKNDAEAVERETQLVAGLQELFPQAGKLTDLGRETVGPVVGRELQVNALLALVTGWVLILIYITIRYEFRFAVAGIVSLVHDTFVVMGCMALFRVELNTAFVAAILTVLGYSINDSVVIFDRIRENMRIRRRADFAQTVNVSLLQTMARSLNTVLTTLFPLIALYFFGGRSITDFALTLIIGIAFGCYSSIFIAAPVVAMWERRSAEARAQAVAAAKGRPTRARAAAGAGAVVEAEGGAAGGATVSQDAVIERLQREDLEERQAQVDADEEAKREERRERRKREKQRAAKKGKRRF